MNIVVAALYKFIDLPDFQEWQAPLRQCCLKNGIKGTLLLAAEGINGTIAGSRAGIDAVLAFLRVDARFDGLECKESYASKTPFYRMKVRLKKEIVTIGIPEINPAKQAGTYIDPKDWNALIHDPEVVLLDTRNTYEVAIGTFKGAINPNTTSFRQFPEFVKQHLDPTKHKKIAMFCTGGIRCEKASSYMRAAGFNEVYHLKGGILKYLETVQTTDSLWQGECFVFDHRVAVKHGLSEGTHEMCYGCRHPLSAQDKASPHYEEGVSCHRCFEHLTAAKRKQVRDRYHQVKLARARGKQHFGAEAG